VAAVRDREEPVELASVSAAGQGDAHRLEESLSLGGGGGLERFAERGPGRGVRDRDAIEPFGEGLDDPARARSLDGGACLVVQRSAGVEDGLGLRGDLAERREGRPEQLGDLADPRERRVARLDATRRRKTRADLCGEAIVRERPDVLRRDPLELRGIEDRGRAPDAVEVERRQKLLGRDDRRVAGGAQPRSAKPFTRASGGTPRSRQEATDAAPCRLDNRSPSGPRTIGRCANSGIRAPEAR